MKELVLQDLKTSFSSDKRIVFKEEFIDDKKIVIVFYQIADNNLWYSNPLALELRGSVFDYDTGECVSRAFEKFFNLNENLLVQQSNLDFTNAIKMNKRDGSLIISMVLNDKVYLKTKKSFYSEVAIEAQQTYKNLDYSLDFLIRFLDDEGYTTLLEYTSPNYQIVLDYGKEPTFMVLGARHKKTGVYYDMKTLEILCKLYEVPFIGFSECDIDDLLSKVKTETNIEGWVIQLQSGQRIKIKTDWYRLRHSVKTKFRERDIAELVVNEQIDDIKSVIIESGLDISLLEEIETRVINELLEIQEYVDNAVKSVLNQDIRDIVVKYKNDIHSFLIIKKYKNNDVDLTDDIKKVWIKHYLKQYPLTCVYNSKF